MQGRVKLQYSCKVHKTKLSLSYHSLFCFQRFLRFHFSNDGGVCDWGGGGGASNFKYPIHAGRGVP